MYTAGSDVSLRQWDLDGGRRFLAQVAPPPDFATSGRVVVGAGDVAYQADKRLAFLDATSGRVGPRRKSAPGSKAVQGSWDLRGHRFAVPAGNQVTVWDAHTQEVVSQGRPLGKFDVTGIDFGADGSRLAITDSSGAVAVVDPATLEPLGASVQLEDVPCAVSLGPDNRRALVVTGAPRSSWAFWAVNCSDWALVDVGTGSVLDHGTMGPDGDVHLVDFSPRGDRAALVDSLGLVVLDVTTGEALRPPLAVHEDRVLSLAFSPDGRRILTSATDASAALWDVETGRLVARVVTPPLFAGSQFDADADSVLVADWYEGAVYRWDTRPEYAVEFACRLAGRDITKAEWAEQFGDRPFQEACPS